MKTILVIGAGSIGSRHARNAHLLGHIVIPVDIDAARAEKLAEEVSAPVYYTSYEEAAEAQKLDAVIIASPSSYHVGAAKFFLEAGTPIFIEKPLATSPEGLSELVNLAEQKKIVTMMGQSYRFHEVFQALKKLLIEGRIGKVYHAHFTGGQYLPDWHPSIDYRTEYMAQKKLGGGVMFTSKSHTLDFVEWFFGKVVDYTGWKDRLSSLEIDVDDSCFLLMKTEQKTVVYAEFDFLERPHRSRATIVGETGTMDADFIANTIIIQSSDGAIETCTFTPDPNKHYVDEIAYFIQLIDSGVSDPSLDIAHGAHIVDLMLDERIRDLTI